MSRSKQSYSTPLATTGKTVLNGRSLSKDPENIVFDFGKHGEISLFVSNISLVFRLEFGVRFQQTFNVFF